MSEPTAPKGILRRGRKFWCAVTLLSSPAIAMVALNLILATPHAREWAAGKIKQRTGLDATIGRISIWPWSGIHLHDLRIHQTIAGGQPVPLLRVADIAIDPQWKPLLKRKLVIHEASIDGACLELPLEMVASLVPSGPGIAASPPVTLHAPPSPGHPTPPTTPGTPPPVGTAPPTTTPTSPEPPAAAPTRWCRIRNASITLNGSQHRLSIDGISADVPFRGMSHSGELHIASIQWANEPVCKDLNFTLHWQDPLLRLEPFEWTVAGLRLRATAATVPRGPLPLELHVECLTQNWQAPPTANGMKLSSQQVAAKGDFIGLLLQPSSWQGRGIIQVRNVELGMPPHGARFDQGQALALLQGGKLSCPDLRLIGEDASILGNANATLANGQWAMAMRVVAAPEQLQALGPRLFPKAPQPLPLTPLATPQRSALDLEIHGDLHQYRLRLGPQPTAPSDENPNPR